MAGLGEVRSALQSLLTNLEAEHAKLLGELEQLRAERDSVLPELRHSARKPSANGDDTPTPPCAGVRGYPGLKDNQLSAPPSGGYPNASVATAAIRAPPVPILKPAPPGGPPPPGVIVCVEHEPSGPTTPAKPKRPASVLWDFARDKFWKGEIIFKEEPVKTMMSNGSLETVELNSVWKRPVPTKPRIMRGGSQMTTASAASGKSMALSMRSNTLKRSGNVIWTSEETIRGCEPFLSRFVVKPDDKRHLIWDVVSMLILFIDVLGTPLDVFEMPENSFRKALELTTLGFWTVDILVTFFCGYHTVKNIEMRPSRIALHYLRTWFLVDFTIVLLEWLSIGEAGILRLGKFARGARVIRMLRIIKVQVIFEELNDFIRNETTMMAFQIGRLVAFILVINHFVACGWWAVGTLIEPVPARWTDQTPMTLESIPYAYLTCLHWALTQFTPASMEVVPVNTWERLYTILILMMGLGAFSSFLASISSLMTQLRSLRTQQQKEDLHIRRYLMEHGVSLELGNHIMFFFRENRRFHRRQRLTEKDVKAFELLPDSLKIRLHWEVYRPAVLPHPLFYNINGQDESGLVEICHRSMHEHILSQGHELFHYGKTAEHMYFVGGGKMDYTAGHNLAESCGNDVYEICESQWVSEMVLWMKWIHHGTVRAKANCELVALDATKFHEHVRHRPLCFEICRHYARLYVQKIAEICRDTEELPEDNWGTIDDLQQLVHITSETMNKDKRLVGGILNMLLNIFSDVREQSGRRMSGANVGNVGERSATRRSTRRATKESWEPENGNGNGRRQERHATLGRSRQLLLQLP